MNKVRSYDLETGKVVWQGAGLTMNPIPSPVAADGLVFLTSGFRGNNLQAIRLTDAKGDITGSAGDRLDARPRHAVRAVAAALRRRSLPAEVEQRHPVGVRREDRQAALPAAAARGGPQRVRVAGRRGRTHLYRRPATATTVVVKHGPAFEVLAINTLDDGFDASPALVDGELYLRGSKHLYCIAEK